ncbi:hypothetical protein ACWDV4_10315 [Micromonospora sp. NPDC003197]
MKAFLPWLTVLAVIMLLNALRLRPLAAAVAVGWLGYCIWTWVRGDRAERRSSDRAR